MPIRITGLNSGLDTESIISALVSSYNYKTNKYKKAQTKLSWKQDAWKTLNSKIYSLYRNAGNLRMSNSLTSKKATVSDTSKVSVTTGKRSVNGTYNVQVTKLATAGYLTGAQLAKGTTSSTKLSELGYTGDAGKISVNAGGKTTDITISKDSTIKEVVSQLSAAGVSASYDEKNRRLYVSAKDTGVENDFSLAGGNASGTAALTSLGLSVTSAADMAEYQEMAQYSNLTADDIKSLVAQKADATLKNSELKTTNVYYENAIAYANASKAVDAIGVGHNADDFTLLKSLSSLSDLSNKYVDSDGNIYDYDKTTGKYSTTKMLEGGSYDETTKKYTAADGQVYEGGSYDAATGNYIAKVEKDDATGLTSASDKFDALATEFGLVKEETDDKGNITKNTEGLDTFKQNLSIITAVSNAAEVNGKEQQELIKKANQALKDGTVDQFVNDSNTAIAQNNADIEANDAVLAANDRITSDMTDEQITAFVEKAAYAKQVADGTVTPPTSAGATRIEGTDSEIYVNGAKYTGSTNNYSINGLDITATGVTGAYDPAGANAVTVAVNTDTQGIYDNVKDFLTQYNSLINEMTALFNADSAKGYEPLTSEEKDAMSDTEVELWEEKIKGSLLRRDDTLQSIMSAMTESMAKSVEINGKKYSLSSFGIKTAGYFNAATNEQNAFHIDGDEDDSLSASNNNGTNSLMQAITNDPDTVLEFMQKLTSNLYDAVDKKMKSTSLSSIYTVYNDKEMASEYSDYTTTIKKWEEKLKSQEDYYYNKFAAMETALAKLNSSSSALSGLLGS